MYAYVVPFFKKKMKVLEEKEIPLAEVKRILEKQRKIYSEKGQEFLFEQKRAIDYVRKYSKLNLKQTRELIKKLSKLDLKLTREQAIKISDLLPETVDDIRAIFAKERFKYEEEEIKKILDVVDQYR